MINARDRLAWLDEGFLQVDFSDYEESLKFEISKGFSINENDKILLLGNNASGKTQLLMKLREIIEVSNDNVVFIDLSDEDINFQKRNRSVGTIDSFLFDFYNEIKLKIENSNSNVRIILLMDNIFTSLREGMDRIFIELFNNLNCTVICSSLLHQYDFPKGPDSENWDSFQKKIIIDNSNLRLDSSDNDKKLIFVDIEIDRNIAEYIQIGLYEELRRISGKATKNIRKLRDTIVRERRRIDFRIGRENSNSDSNEKLEQLMVKRQNLESKLEDYERRLELERQVGDSFEIAINMENIEMLSKEIAKIHNDIINLRSLLKVVDSAEKMPLVEHKKKITEIEDELHFLHEKIIFFTGPMRELDELVKKDGLTYSDKKAEILKNVEYEQIFSLNEGVRALNSKLRSTTIETEKKLLKSQEEIGARYGKEAQKDWDDTVPQWSGNNSRAIITEHLVKSWDKGMDSRIPEALRRSMAERRKGLPNPRMRKNTLRLQDYQMGKFGIKTIDSSVSMVLHNLREEENPDDSRKVALYFSKIFRVNYETFERKTKKIIIVNDIEKMLKWTINTHEDRENTLIILHNNEIKRRELEFTTHVGLSPNKFGQADIFIIDCEKAISASKIKMYLNKFRKNGTARHGHLMFVDIANTYSEKNLEYHPFNSWIKNLEKRTPANNQSQSAGLHKIIKLDLNGKALVKQSTRKASELLKGIGLFYDIAIGEWNEMNLKNLIKFKQSKVSEMGNIKPVEMIEINSYLNEKIKTYDFVKEKNLYKQIWKSDLETEDSLEEWYNSKFKN